MSFYDSLWDEKIYKEYVDYLYSNKSEKLMNFNKKLIPNCESIIGLKVPFMRNEAKQIAKGDWKGFFKFSKADSYEERVIKGLVIGYSKADMDTIFQYLDKFVPLIDSWSVCDVVCSNLKMFKNHKDEAWEYLKKYLKSDKEYDIRFAVVCFLDYFIDDEHIDALFEIFNNINHEGYYVKMAVAWAVSVCFVKYRDKTFDFIKSNKTDDFTNNKSIQKIRESFRVSTEDKEKVKAFVRRS